MLKKPPPPTAPPTRPVFHRPPSPPPASQSSDALEILLTEHLGFPPMDYVVETVDMVNEITFAGVNAFADYVDDLGFGDEETEKIVGATETLFDSNVDRAFDAYELYMLDKVLKFPAGLPVKLTHYQDLDLNVTESDEAACTNEIEELEGAVAAAREANRMLEERIEQGDRERPELVRVAEAARRIEEVTGKHADATSNLKSILPTLETTHALTESLRTRTARADLGDLVAARHEASGVPYVESVVAAAIERLGQRAAASRAINAAQQPPRTPRTPRTPRARANAAKDGKDARMGEHDAEWKEAMDVGTIGDFQAWEDTVPNLVPPTSIPEASHE
ncbi:hypothetical protein BDK51DRAFT_52991 [Blyttiomyces helicus]|uniref:Mis12 protein-domain-containing protein n=1 Tax=Blyttiomyces helicus TaxID=388810 RepID=A0A4P9WAV3_9FUNG|nr:hypothetical protein BDK51DRAFT_52991 [Blyttiomyces helicus]|eukprot:RKO88020.1 hypothetical protein BDK51DRAFT_52991 [Blyttiomyces helicus]